jgi:hypothetical protein
VFRGCFCLPVCRCQSIGYSTQQQVFEVADRTVGFWEGAYLLLVFGAFGFVGSIFFFRVAPFVTRQRTVILCFECAAMNITLELIPLIGSGFATFRLFFGERASWMSFRFFVV